MAKEVWTETQFDNAFAVLERAKAWGDVETVAKVRARIMNATLRDDDHILVDYDGPEVPDIPKGQKVIKWDPIMGRFLVETPDGYYEFIQDPANDPRTRKVLPDTWRPKPGAVDLATGRKLSELK